MSSSIWDKTYSLSDWETWAIVFAPMLIVSVLWGVFYYWWLTRGSK